MYQTTLKAAAIVGFVATAGAAHAIGAPTIVDLTDPGQFGVGDLSQNYVLSNGQSITATVTTSGTATFTDYDGENPAIPDLSTSGLFAAADPDNAFDGLGIDNDEITFSQEATVSFSSAVNLLGFHFLDLFFESGGEDLEVAQVFLGDTLVASFMASEIFSTAPQAGYRFGAFGPVAATSVTFRAGFGNDAVGQPDYSLAGINVAPIPLPAPVLLFATALLGLRLAGRRNRAAA